MTPTPITLRTTILRAIFFLALAVVSSAALTANAQSFAASHAKVSLVSENNALEARQPAWVGILFDLEKGWHIYWVNPGDSGEPPKIQWTLPSGFSAGEIRWPVPVRLGTGTVIDYGYEGRVLLPVQLQVPPDYHAGTPSTISADVRYLICREVCIPAKAHVSLAIPAGDGSSADSLSLDARRELFRTAREHEPKPAPANWKVQAVDNAKTFVLSLETGSPESKAVFFPLDEDQMDNAAPQAAAATAHGVRITLKKSDQLLKPISELRGVVVFGADPTRAFEISAPVAPSASRHS